MVIPQTIIEEQNTIEILIKSTDEKINSNSKKEYPV